jgi:soluble lytic murein transglycosylase-like protein
VAALKPLALAVALLVATPAAADPVDRWRAEIAEASARFAVPVAWIERVMRAESGGHTMLNGRPITSPVGAMGLMQLMPATWAAMRAAHRLGGNPHDPRENILAGTAYLRAMYDRFGYPGLFAAYNAGPGRYAAHLATGRALPTETRAYLAQVSGTPSVSLPSLPQRPPRALFVALRTSNTAADPSPSRVSDEPPDALFAVHAPR